MRVLEWCSHTRQPLRCPACAVGVMGRRLPRPGHGPLYCVEGILAACLSGRPGNNSRVESVRAEESEGQAGGRVLARSEMRLVVGWGFGLGLEIRGRQTLNTHHPTTTSHAASSKDF
jgi:hypothetical protein